MDKKNLAEGTIRPGRPGDSRRPMPRMRRGHGPGSVPIESPRDFKKALRRLIAYFGSQVVPLMPASALILAGVVLNTIAPAVVGKAIKNHIELDPNVELFARKMAILLGLYLAVWLTNGLGGVLITRIANRVLFRLRNEAFTHIQKLSMSFFDRRGIGDIISRLTNDVEMIHHAMTNALSGLVSGPFSIIGVLIAMFALNLQLSLVVIGTVPVMIILTAIIGTKVRAAFRKNQAQVGLLNANIQESVSAVRVIQTFNRQREEFRKFDRINEQARKIGIRAEFTSFAFMPVMRFMTSLTLALIVGIGGTLVLTNRDAFSVGLLTAFILYSRRFFEPLRQITGVYNVLQSALAGAERIFAIMDTQPEIWNKADAVKLDDIQGDVEFKDISFAYVDNKPVLKNINLRAKKGQVVAIVGPTGAGKTTMVNLLSRFYDVGSGSILIDGKDIRDLDIDSLRTKMGVVLQEPFFFAMSIKENLLYGNPNASEKEIREAAGLANADSFIRRLPQGYDTVLSERGMNLSQGERQLLAIARAILADPKILILDEATSNIDSLTEIHIQKGLLELMKDRTSFIIAHRLSTIKNAHNVLVLHNRKIIEEGTHKELMERGGFYSRMYKMQDAKVEITEDMEI
ncbi:putative ABC transporter ATP-binding protein [subsurface metagenome]